MYVNSSRVFVPGQSRKVPHPPHYAHHAHAHISTFHAGSRRWKEENVSWRRTSLILFYVTVFCLSPLCLRRGVRGRSRSRSRERRRRDRSPSPAPRGRGRERERDRGRERERERERDDKGRGRARRRSRSSRSVCSKWSSMRLRRCTAIFGLPPKFRVKHILILSVCCNHSAYEFVIQTESAFNMY